MQISTYSEQRSTERLSLSLSAIVKIRENEDSVWKEATKLITVSRNGAGFYLQKQCQIGQLVSLIIPLPKHLRSYDHDKELYRVWGLVQHCYPITVDDQPQYHVGIAFTGKSAPQGYSENPMQSYRLCGMNKQGLWEIVEAQNSFVARKFSRFWVSIEVSLEIAKSEENEPIIEETLTENVSSKGASVFSDLNVEIGDIITFKNEDYDFSAQAVVRNCKIGSDERRRLHIEFINTEFPIKELILPVEEPEED